jgi:predicted lipid-binding transport protein (Tim44 family)
MGGEFQFFDIILFGMVAAFLILRLRSVLGRRTGHERRPTDPFRREPAENRTEANDKVVELPNRAPPVDVAPLVLSEANAGLAQIKASDPEFDPEQFLAGARAAFEMVVSAFAAGDKQKLRGLLSNEVFDNFAGAIDSRAKKGETLETKLVAIRAAELADAEMRGQTAFVTVKFTSEQSNVTRDAEGRIVDGVPGQSEDVVDLWSFARNTRARDPNWTLVETRSPQA